MKKTKILLPIIIILLSVFVFIVLKKTKATVAAPVITERIWQINTVAAEITAIAPQLKLYGQLETPALVNAVAPMTGWVLTTSANEGEVIKKGQVLLTLDPRDYYAKIAQSKARVNELNALINSERLHYKSNQKAFKHEKSLLNLELAAVKRIQKLKDKKLASKLELDNTQEELQRQRLSVNNRQLDLNDHQPRLQQLKARLEFAQAELELTQLDFERSQIIAPFEGVIEKLHVAAGNQVKENQLLISFYPLDKLEVRAKIPALFQTEIQQALQQGVVLTAITTDLGKLTLSRLAGTADSRGIDGLFNIQQNNALLRLGTNLSLLLQRPVQQHAILLPFSALYDNNRVYKVVDEHLQKIQVNYLGEYQHNGKNKLLISSDNIEAGDKIMTTHLPNAVSGLRVAY